MMASRRLWLLMAISVIVMLSLAACGGGGDDDADSDATGTRIVDSGGGDDGGGEAPEDVCGLLTTEEVSAATQVEMEEGVPDNSPPFFGCDWEDDLGLHTATIEILTGDDDSNLSYFEASGEAEAIDGLGERAQYTDLIGLEVLTDHYVVGVRMFSFDLEDDMARTATLALGEIVIERLGD